MRLHKDSTPIASIADWGQYAPPKAEHQWVDGRSAKELARAWCGDAGPRVPDEVARALASHPDLASLEIVEMSPEARVPFDGRRGEPRNADLAGIARDADGIAVVHVEGKADETFGQRLRDVQDAAAAMLEKNPRSGAVERVRDLRAALLPAGFDPAAADDLRYQLFTATAAALADAGRREARLAVLVVHEFVSDRTTEAKRRENAADLDAFVRAISGGRVGGVPAGGAVGPIMVPGAPLLQRPVPLYVVKAVRDVRQAAR